MPALAYVVHSGSVDVFKSDIVKRPRTKLEDIMSQAKDTGAPKTVSQGHDSA